ncbi:general transcription factor 3C polypeptide 5-like [Patiria miniata]|uniref:Uncharacterized protein n=1 Tax=Patiria miniata TaxID=46514 RepID=A0A913Z401_PATMI|nr:general transcription factor 3C polypeptide 5-like [Patiria miniata]
MADNTMEDENSSASVDAQKLPQLVCVEFPARVQNVDKMFKTLGGEEAVSKTLSANSAPKLQMKFRPDDPFCRPLYASQQPTTSILLRVKKRYKKAAPTAEMEVDSQDAGDGDDEVIEAAQEEAEYKTELVGVIDSVYQFKGMCDYQYLPLHRNKETGGMESLIEKIVPTKPEDGSYLQQDVPLFMLPPVFSRTDQPLAFHFQPDIVPSIESLSYKVANRTDKNIVGSGRARRPHNAYMVPFEQDGVPTAPHPDAVLYFEKGKARDNSIEVLQDELMQVFARRPVWSRSALRQNCTLTDRQLTVLLPSVSYYFCSGPWRCTWVRLGYDPRTAPDGLQYQPLDFRVRRFLYSSKSVMPVDKTQRFKSTCYSRFRTARPARHSQFRQEQKTMAEKEAYFIFKEGLVPAYNNMFYQLCDIHVEEIQAMIRAGSVKTDQGGPVGYFKTEVLDQMRSILTEKLQKTLEQEALTEDGTAEEDGDDSSRPSTSQAGGVDMEDADMDEEYVEDDDDDDDIEDGPEEADDNDALAVDGFNMDEDDDSDDNEMGTEFLEFLAGTS